MELILSDFNMIQGDNEFAEDICIAGAYINELKKGSYAQPFLAKAKQFVRKTELSGNQKAAIKDTKKYKNWILQAPYQDNIEHYYSVYNFIDSDKAFSRYKSSNESEGNSLIGQMKCHFLPTNYSGEDLAVQKDINNSFILPDAHNLHRIYNVLSDFIESPGT